LNPDKISEGLAGIGNAIARKSLKEPSNIQILLDIIMWLSAIAFAIILSITHQSGSFLLFCLCFIVTIASWVFCLIHYCNLSSRQKTRKRAVNRRADNPH